MKAVKIILCILLCLMVVGLGFLIYFGDTVGNWLVYKLGSKNIETGTYKVVRVDDESEIGFFMKITDDELFIKDIKEYYLSTFLNENAVYGNMYIAFFENVNFKNYEIYKDGSINFTLGTGVDLQYEITFDNETKTYIRTSLQYKLTFDKETKTYTIVEMHEEHTECYYKLKVVSVTEEEYEKGQGKFDAVFLPEEGWTSP